MYRQGVTKKGVTVKSYDLFGSSVALDGDANVLAVGLRGDDGFKQYRNSYDISKAGGVFIIAFDDTDFSNGEVVSRIGNGYQNLSSNSNSAKTNKCAVIANDLDTNSHTDLIPKKDDELGSAVSFNHDGSLLAIGSTGDNGKNNNKNNSGAVRLFKFMNSGSVVSAATGTPTYIGSIGQDYDYLDTSDSSVHAVTLANGDRFGNSVAFDKDADRLAVSYWDQSVSGES